MQLNPEAKLRSGEGHHSRRGRKHKQIFYLMVTGRAASATDK
jgi:hypothetical protein